MFLNEGDEDIKLGDTLDNGDTNEGSLTNRKLSQPNNRASSFAEMKEENDDFSLGKDDYDLKRAGHPNVCIATVLFKGAAFFIYFFVGLFMSKVLTFIIVTVLGSLDFWVVKNISGRILVGLRWWSSYDEKGSEIWKFETHSKQFKANGVDKTFFWSGQVIGTLVWGIFLVINILGLDLIDSLLLGINFFLCGTNLYGYYKCNSEYEKKLGDLKKKLGRKGLMTLADKFV